MRVLRLAWLGIPTPRYEAMVPLFRDVMGMRVQFAEETTVELSLPNDDRVQLFAPGHPYFGFFGSHAKGPVPLFEVEDVREARAELAARDIEVIGDIESDASWNWIHVRAPDGNLYELASQRRSQ